MTVETPTEVEESTDAMTVQAAWALYDLQERELWEEYEADPSYVNGRIYLAGEQLIRRRCEKTVRNIRYQRGDATAA